MNDIVHWLDWAEQPSEFIDSEFPKSPPTSLFTRVKKDKDKWRKLMKKFYKDIRLFPI